MIRNRRNKRRTLIELDPRPPRKPGRLAGLVVALALIGAGFYHLALWLLALVFGA